MQQYLQLFKVYNACNVFKYLKLLYVSVKRKKVFPDIKQQHRECFLHGFLKAMFIKTSVLLGQL